MDLHMHRWGETKRAELIRSYLTVLPRLREEDAVCKVLDEVQRLRGLEFVATVNSALKEIREAST